MAYCWRYPARDWFEVAVHIALFWKLFQQEMVLHANVCSADSWGRLSLTIVLNLVRVKYSAVLIKSFLSYTTRSLRGEQTTQRICGHWAKVLAFRFKTILIGRTCDPIQVPQIFTTWCTKGYVKFGASIASNSMESQMGATLIVRLPLHRRLTLSLRLHGCNPLSTP